MNCEHDPGLPELDALLRTLPVHLIGEESYRVKGVFNEKHKELFRGIGGTHRICVQPTVAFTLKHFPIIWYADVCCHQTAPFPSFATSMYG